MDKKSLIGISILAVVLLVLGSLSNVVGYQSVKSSTVNDSPLFSMRTQRATNQQQNIITSQYLGLGKRTILQFPFRDNTIGQLKEAIDIINKMDEKTFAQFTEVCIQRAKQDKSFKDVASGDIVKIFYLFRTKPEMVLNSLTYKDNQDFTESQVYTACVGPKLCLVLSIFIMSILTLVLISGGATLILIYLILAPFGYWIIWGWP